MKKPKILYHQKKIMLVGIDSKSIWKIFNEELGKRNNKCVINGVLQKNTLIENEKRYLQCI